LFFFFLFPSPLCRALLVPLPCDFDEAILRETPPPSSSSCPPSPDLTNCTFRVGIPLDANWQWRFVSLAIGWPLAPQFATSRLRQTFFLLPSLNCSPSPPQAVVPHLLSLPVSYTPFRFLLGLLFCGFGLTHPPLVLSGSL